MATACWLSPTVLLLALSTGEFGAWEHAATTEINATITEINPTLAIRFFITNSLLQTLLNLLRLATDFQQT
jgi:hypothetical protein